MRRLIVTENITADGVIDLAGGWFTAGTSSDTDAEQRSVEEEHRSSADALLVGRHTFEAFRSFWPGRPDDPTGVSAYLDRVAKYVVSSTLTDDELGWAGSQVLRGRLESAVQQLKEQPGGDIVATGSTRLVHALIGARLVDEYRLFVHPVVVGRGARLFTDAAAGALRLLEARPFPSGVALLRYEPL
jgi:dihydrofolate reductase